MNTYTENGVNVASKESTSGHFAQGAVNVVLLDEVTETSWIEGESMLKTKNHTDLKLEKSAIVTIQNVYNPFSKMFEKSRD